MKDLFVRLYSCMRCLIVYKKTAAGIFNMLMVIVLFLRNRANASTNISVILVPFTYYGQLHHIC